MRIGVVILAVSAVLGVSAASAQNERLTVSPSTGLQDGDIVEFVGPDEADFHLTLQCDDPVTPGVCTWGSGTNIVWDNSTGGSYAVQRLVYNTDTGAVSDCAVVQCYLARFGMVPSPPGPVSYTDVVPLEFERTDAMWLDYGPNGMTSTVRAAFPDTAAGAGAWVMRCTGLNGRIVCGDVGTLSTVVNGFFQGVVRRGQTLTLPDGRDAPCVGSACRVAIVVVGPGELRVIGAQSL